MDPYTTSSTSTTNPLGANQTPASTPAGSNHPATGMASAGLAAAVSPADVRLSYKFQRLREKLRQAIASGELAGKLPGERQLARRFRVNAKTLSKALTDLAAEGLLERSIGRGTFVKGSGPADSTSDSGGISATTANPVAERWLIVCDPVQAQGAVVRQIVDSNPNAQIVNDTRALRPSFLSAFKAVIDFAHETPVAFLRDMVVRNTAVVLVGREPTTYSMNAVLVDRTLGASCLARELMLAGHTRFVAVERRGSSQVSTAIRKAAERYAPDATVDTCFASEALGAVEQGATALICDDLQSAIDVKAALQSASFEMPAQVSLAAIGSGDPGTGGDNWPCSGYYVPADQKAQAILQAVRDGAARRPTTLWLTGMYYDAGTTGPTESMRYVPAAAANRSADHHGPMLHAR